MTHHHHDADSPAALARAGSPAALARADFRSGLVRPTSGLAPGRTQANLVVLPRDWAFDMLLFAQRNPGPMPLLDVTEPGEPTTSWAPGADLRTDLPLYRVWRGGELVEEVSDATDHWGEDAVAFLIGCSFGFEAALQRAGVPVRNLDQGRNVAMYRTDRPLRPAGRMRGELVVSMRPVPPELVATAVTVSAAVPFAHGAPVHVGDPSRLGVADLAAPDYGEATDLEPGDVPVFWPCGVTPQRALEVSRPPWAITHAPGHMFITDAVEGAARV
ncbi:putative hydro-lyase [Micrococcus sp. 2A]|uniref:putative hydro-lyase n=1 Tax=Micrococcus sp. 2A TaxID=3142261 RepID=UPI0031BA37B6